MKKYLNIKKIKNEENINGKETSTNIKTDPKQEASKAVEKPKEETKIIPEKNFTPANTNNTPSVAYKINELQQLISNTNKFVDNVENLVNSSNDLNREKERTLRAEEKIEEIDENDYDYFHDDKTERMLNIDSNTNKLNNIFKRNMQEDEANIKEEDIRVELQPSDNKLNKNETNFVTNSSVVTNNKFNNIPGNEKVGLYEIPEDLQCEETSEMRDDLTLQTNKFEVSDSLVDRDKMGEMINASQFTNVFNTMTTIEQPDLLNTQTTFNDSDLQRNMYNINLKDKPAKNCDSSLPNTTVVESIKLDRLEIQSRNFSIARNEESTIQIISKYNTVIDNEKDNNVLIQILNELKTTVQKLDSRLNIAKPVEPLEEVDPTMAKFLDKYLDKYSQLLLKRIDENLKINK